VAFEGQPLEGNYGTWKVSHIEPREITLTSANGEELQLKLQVHDIKIEQPPEMEKDDSGETSESAKQARDSDSDEPLSRAEEIRQRIAQRREELRRAAEDREHDEAEAPAVDYRQAIQSMVSGTRRKKEQDENER
jgi:hypothetical protein